MTFISLPTVGTLTLDVAGLIQGNPGLINQIAGDALAHALHSYIRRAGRRRGASRRQLRKASNRKRRWFVDNIIMHHKRIHDRNRAIVISNARTRALARRDAKKNLSPQQSSTLQRDHNNQQTRWQNGVNLKERGSALRGRVDARRMRARSRWLSVMKASS